MNAPTFPPIWSDAHERALVLHRAALFDTMRVLLPITGRVGLESCVASDLLAVVREDQGARK